MIGKLKLPLSLRVELCGVSDDVLQLFTNRIEYAVDAHFPVVMTAVPGEVSTGITLTVSTILENDDGRG